MADVITKHRPSHFEMKQRINRPITKPIAI
jgi:hypothetical protein